jgi:ABC-type antimicrobial peptide transport system permease subunit
MILSYFKSFFNRHKVKTIILVISIAIYFALTIALLALNKTLPEVASLPFQKIGVGVVVQKTGQIPEHMVGAIFPHSNGPIYDDEIAPLRELDFVQGSDSGLYFWYFGDKYFKTTFGVQDKGSSFAKLLKQNVEQGVFDISGKNALITADFAQKHNLKLADKINFGKNAFAVTGILKANLTGNIIPADIYINLKDAQGIVRGSKEMQRVYGFNNTDFVNVVSLDINPKWQGDKESAIKQLDKEYIVFSEKTFSQEVLEQIKLVSSLGKTMFVVLGIILLIVFSLLISYNLKTREKEIAILRMIGWSFKDLKKQFISESAILLAVALIVGNILAIGSLFVLRAQTISMELPWELSAKPHFLPEENAIERTITANLPIHFDWVNFAGLSLLFMLIFLLVSIVVFRRLKNIKPSEYMK